MRRILCVAVAGACLSSGTLRADFTYEQTTQVTGGAMAAAMKLASTFSKKLREPMKSTVIVKGDRMAQINAGHVQVIDLGRETFTDIDTEKRTYSVITFADFQRAMDEMAKKMAKEKRDSNAEMKFNVSVKDTGAKKNINGFDTKQALMILAFEAQDKESNQSGQMAMTSDMWLAPKIAGYDEVMDFHKRLATKLNWSTMASGLQAFMQRAETSKGMAEMAKEMSKLNGVPVYQIVRMGAAKDMAEAEKMASAPSKSVSEMPTAGEAAGSAAGNAAEGAATSAVTDRLGKLGGIGGRLGGLGGFGRKKKQAEQQPEAAPAAQQQAEAGSALLMEMTTEMTSFTPGPADASKFEVPAGFKQVENEMQKQLRKN